MATKILTSGAIHIIFNDANYTKIDTMQNTSSGYFSIKRNSDQVVVVVMYADGFIDWLFPPAGANWVPKGQHLEVTLP